MRVSICTERELQRGEGGDHTPEEVVDAAQLSGAEQMAVEALSGRPSSPGSPRQDTGAMMDDLDTVRREVISMGRTVQELSGRSVPSRRLSIRPPSHCTALRLVIHARLAVPCSVDDVQQRMASMETQMTERFSRLETLLTAGRGELEAGARAAGNGATDQLLPDDGARP